MRVTEPEIVEVGEWTTSGTALTLDCGCVVTGVAHMTFKLGGRIAHVHREGK